MKSSQAKAAVPPNQGRALLLAQFAQHVDQARGSASSLMIFHPQNLRAHRVASQASDVGVAVMTGQYRQRLGAQHITLAVCVGTDVAQEAAVDPGVVDAGGGQKVGEKRQLCIGYSAESEILMDEDSTAGGVHHHGLQCLRLDKQLRLLASPIWRPR